MPSAARLQLGIDSVRFVTQGVWSTFAVNLLEGCEGQARVVLFKTPLTLATQTLRKFTVYIELVSFPTGIGPVFCVLKLFEGETP